MRVGQRREKPGRLQRFLMAGIIGALMGALVGGLIGASLDGIGALPGALVGALLLGLGEGLADITRQRGQLKPEAWRIFTGVLFGAALGGLISMVLEGANPLLLV